jgi:hypothetical protein
MARRCTFWWGWFSLLLIMVPALIQPTWAQVGSPELLQQLELAVESRNWKEALAVVDQLIQVLPERRQELQDYREQLLRLQTTTAPLPPLPPAPSQVEILRVQASVATTRFEQRIERFDSDDRDAPLIIVPDPEFGPLRVLEVPIRLELPDQYGIRVSLRGSPHVEEEVRVRATLSGGGESTVHRTLLVGGAVATREEEFLFSSRQVQRPRQVQIEIENGSRRTFTVSLPSRDTVLSQQELTRRGIVVTPMRR